MDKRSDRSFSPLINSHFSSSLISDWLPASVSSPLVSRCVSPRWVRRPHHHQRNKRKSLSADLRGSERSLHGKFPSPALIENDSPALCVSAGDAEPQEEVWARAVDRFSQRVGKFESGPADISAAMLPEHGEGFFLSEST